VGVKLTHAQHKNKIVHKYKQNLSLTIANKYFQLVTENLPWCCR